MKKILLICLALMLNACAPYGYNSYGVSLSGSYYPNGYYQYPYYGNRYYRQPYYGNRYYGVPYYSNRYYRQPYYNAYRYNGYRNYGYNGYNGWNNWNNRGYWRGGNGFQRGGWGWGHHHR